MFSQSTSSPNKATRAGAVLVLSAILMVAICGMAAMGIDVGYMMLVKTQLQIAADSGALAGANSLHLSEPEIVAVGKEFAGKHKAGKQKIGASEIKVEVGIWDAAADVFTPGAASGNAVRVTTSRAGQSLFFSRVIGTKAFDAEASAIAMANPKDIAFLIDLSGSMNDDTEPAWATTTINKTFKGNTANGLMQDVYTDLGFGKFPGKTEYLGHPHKLPKSHIAYAKLTSDVGPLSKKSIPNQYRIKKGDNENVRRKKSYSWIIDTQLARLMPKARPKPSSKKNYGYWEKYIDYVLRSSWVKAPKPPAPPKPKPKPKPGPKPAPKPTPKPKPKPPSPPIGLGPWVPSAEGLAGSPLGGAVVWGAHRVGALPMLAAPASAAVYGPAATGPGLPRVGGMYGKYAASVPPSQDGDRIYKFNNPNKSAFPKANANLPQKLRNYFGYTTYVQFLMDHGRDLRPDGKRYTELSLDSGDARLHSEKVAGRSFKFPPRTQPMHAVRRSTIAAMDVVDDRNTEIPSKGHRDRIAVITFDSSSGTQLLHKFTTDYSLAMESVSKVQAVGDKGTTTATETGMLLARKLLTPKSKGGEARDRATRVAVILTDGMPNAYSTSDSDIDSFFGKTSVSDQYGGGYYWLDAALMQAHILEADGVDVYPVGIGMGTDYDFMDRVARLGGTAGADGEVPRGSGDPAAYEAMLTKIFEDIVKKPTARLVE